MITAFLQDVRHRVDACLIHEISSQHSDYCTDSNATLAKIAEAAQYCTANGGKRLRSALFIATIDALQSRKPLEISAADTELIAASIECIHSYSLIHDDLPAMDNDDLRRGQATCHIAYSEATAILVGDGLQTLAFELLTKTSLAPAIQIKLVQELAKAAGNLGMIGGQAIDMDSQEKEISIRELEQLHTLKTGALIRVSVRLAAICAEVSEGEFSLLDSFAANIGLAFQVHDDVLDIESDTQTLGKQQGADLALNKSTYPKLLGLEGAKQKSQHLIQTAFATLDQLAIDGETLKGLAQFVIDRRH